MTIDAQGGTTDRVAWGLLAVMAGACGFTTLGLGFTIDPARAVAPTLGVASLWGAAWWGRRHARPRLVAGATAFVQMTLFTIIGVVLTYGLAARGGGVSWDAALMAADRRLGFDWPALLRAVDEWPVALWIGGIAYHSLTLQMIVCIVVLSATRRVDALRMAVAAAIASGFVTIAIAGMMPAVGHLFDPAAYRNLWPSIAWLERDLIAGLRDGTGRTLDLSMLMGIVTFPSFHATLPVILAWAQRDVAWMRVVAPVWAALTIVATPVFGGHYVVDVFGGLALAVPAILLAPWLVRARAARVERDAWFSAGRPVPR